MRFRRPQQDILSNEDTYRWAGLSLSGRVTTQTPGSGSARQEKLSPYRAERKAFPGQRNKGDLIVRALCLPTWKDIIWLKPGYVHREMTARMECGGISPSPASRQLRATLIAVDGTNLNHGAIKETWGVCIYGRS